MRQIKLAPAFISFFSVLFFIVSYECYGTQKSPSSKLSESYLEETPDSSTEHSSDNLNKTKDFRIQFLDSKLLEKELEKILSDYYNNSLCLSGGDSEPRQKKRAQLEEYAKRFDWSLVKLEKSISKNRILKLYGDLMSKHANTIQADCTLNPVNIYPDINAFREFVCSPLANSEKKTRQAYLNDIKIRTQLLKQAFQANPRDWKLEDRESVIGCLSRLLSCASK